MGSVKFCVDLWGSVGVCGGLWKSVEICRELRGTADLEIYLAHTLRISARFLVWPARFTVLQRLQGCLRWWISRVFTVYYVSFNLVELTYQVELLSRAGGMEAGGGMG